MEEVGGAHPPPPLLLSSVLLKVRGEPPFVTVDLVEVEELLE